MTDSKSKYSLLHRRIEPSKPVQIVILAGHGVVAEHLLKRLQERKILRVSNDRYLDGSTRMNEINKVSTTWQIIFYFHF
jgi:hypothetical protein